MEKCLICNKDADQTGSHIVPHFLMKRIDNEEGSTDRDKEMGFVITEKETTSYFGQSILPEKLEEIYGDVTDELIEENEIDGIVDYFFCKNCESRLANLESEYSKIFQKKITDEENYTSFSDGFIAFVFWSSVIWRLSLQPESDFKLKPKEENRLQRILSKYLKDKIGDIKPDNNDSDLKNIGYKLLRAANYSIENYTFLHSIPFYRTPYSILIDELILFFYFKESHLKGMIQDFYGSEKLKSKAIFNKPFDEEKTLKISDQDLKDVIDRMILKGAEVRYEYLNSLLDQLHQKLGGKGQSMYPRLKQMVIKNLLENDEKLGKRDTIPNQIEIITNTIMDYHTKANKDG